VFPWTPSRSHGFTGLQARNTKSNTPYDNLLINLQKML
jgi:hypothetical protein